LLYSPATGSGIPVFHRLTGGGGGAGVGAGAGAGAIIPTIDAGHLPSVQLAGMTTGEYSVRAQEQKASENMGSVDVML